MTRLEEERHAPKTFIHMISLRRQILDVFRAVLAWKRPVFSMPLFTNTCDKTGTLLWKWNLRNECEDGWLAFRRNIWKFRYSRGLIKFHGWNALTSTIGNLEIYSGTCPNHAGLNLFWQAFFMYKYFQKFVGNSKFLLQKIRTWNNRI